MIRLLTIVLFLAGVLPGCTYLRETPSYREEGRTRFGPSPAPTSSETHEPSIDADSGFYQQKSKVLGYNLNGNENPALLKEVKKWLGTPYLYGGNTLSGADCSGFVGMVYKQVYNISLDRITINMAQNTRRVNKRHLQEGDLVFFSINSRRVSHVGIYLSNNRFVHASSSRGVVVDSLDNDYFSRHFAFGGRIRK